MSALLWWRDFTYTICRVTLPTERVSWNNKAFYKPCTALCHAPHGACELKWPHNKITRRYLRHAPHGACELKFLFSYRRGVFPVTLPTERVSWNFLLFFPLFLLVLSRSPRSVWVEIIFLLVDSQPTFVTLPTERVSWNLCKNWKWLEISSHAPHGACELKLEL